MRQRGRFSLLGQRLAGFLAFCGLAFSAFIAGRDECPERSHAQQVRARASLSTLAPITSTGRDAQGAPSGNSERTAAGDLFSPAAAPAVFSRAGAAACLYQDDRSAKLKPTP